MKQAEHERHTQKVLGAPFPEVHKYLDEFHDTMGPSHRSKRHHAGGVEACIAKWGMLAGAAACLHIWADEMGIIQADDGEFVLPLIIGAPKPSDLVDGFSKALDQAGYIHGGETS